MTVQTHKYIKMNETNLRAEYGGGAVLFNGDSKEVTKKDLTLRYIFEQVDWPSLGVSQLCQFGDDGVDAWLKMSDGLYTAVSAHFTAAELATVVSAAPAGYSDNSNSGVLLPNIGVMNIYYHGDSIAAGAGTTSGDHTDTYMYQGMELIADYTDKYRFLGTALGSSSFNNLDASINPNVNYPENWAKSYNQRHETLPLNSTGQKTLFVVAMGTNDIAYGVGIGGKETFDRAIVRIGALRARFPNIVIAIVTICKRSGNVNYGKEYNDLVRANYQKIGADLLLDVDLDWGDIDSADQPDGVHPNTAGHAIPAPSAAITIETAETLLNAGHTQTLYAPAVITAPVSSGTLEVGQVLSCTDGVWSGVPIGTLTYQWKDALGVDISGETSASYTLQVSDIASSSPTRVTTMTNSEGSGTSQSADLGAVVAAPAFVPSDITGLRSWHDASDETTITDTGTFVWADKHTNNYDATQATAADKPLSGTRTVNGLNVIDFPDGTDDLNMDVPFEDFVNGDSTSFIVGAGDTTIGTQSLMIGLRSAADRQHYRVGSSFRYMMGSGSDISTTSDTDAHVFAGSKNSNALKFYVDGGTVAGTGTGTSQNFDTSQLGVGLDGWIGEIIVYHGVVLTDSEINQVGNYLATKWGLTWTDI